MKTLMTTTALILATASVSFAAEPQEIYNWRAQENVAAAATQNSAISFNQNGVSDIFASAQGTSLEALSRIKPAAGGHNSVVGASHSKYAH